MRVSSHPTCPSLSHAQVMMRMMAKTPEERPTLVEIRRRLAELRAPAPAAAAASSSMRMRVTFAVALVLVMAAIAFAVVSSLR